MDTQVILSREEARAEKDRVRKAYDSGVIDVITAVEMAWDITCRTVPTR